MHDKRQNLRCYLLNGLKEFNGTEVDEVEVFGTFGGDLSAVSRP
jgi:hypothetical protein